MNTHDAAQSVGTFAKAAKAAKAPQIHGVEFSHAESTPEKKTLPFNEISTFSEPSAHFGQRVPAKAAKAAKPPDKISIINEIDSFFDPIEGCYSAAKACYSSKATAARCREMLKRFAKTGHIDDADVIAVLGEVSGEFIERAAICEFDGNLPRAVAEQTALEEQILECLERMPARQRSRAVLWSDLRRLAILELLSQVSEE